MFCCSLSSSVIVIGLPYAGPIMINTSAAAMFFFIGVVSHDCGMPGHLSRPISLLYSRRSSLRLRSYETRSRVTEVTTLALGVCTCGRGSSRHFPQRLFYRGNTNAVLLSAFGL